MVSKINPSRLIAAHVATLTDFSTKERRWREVVGYLVLPWLLGFGVVGMGFRINQDEAGIALTATAILGGLMLNLLLLAHSMLERVETAVDQPNRKGQMRRTLLREVVSNISFATLVLVFGIGALLVPVVTDAEPFICISTFLATGLLITAAPPILMILKRMHDLLDVDEQPSAT